MGGSASKEHVDGGTSRFDNYGIVYQSVCGDAEEIVIFQQVLGLGRQII